MENHTVSVQVVDEARSNSEPINRKGEHIEMKRAELKKRFPDMSAATDEASDLAIGLVIALDGLEEAEIDIFRNFLMERHNQN